MQLRSIAQTRAYRSKSIFFILNISATCSPALLVGYSIYIIQEKLLSMRFDIYEFRHIVSNIDDLLFMSGSTQPINISVDRDDITSSDVFMKLSFSLINGNSEIRIYQKQAFFIYLDTAEEIIKKIEFDNSHIREIHGSFNTALKQILIFDRQNSSQVKNLSTSLDRASFGLAEVN